jgi:pyrrolysyl-tRNA synthetase-like protein
MNNQTVRYLYKNQGLLQLICKVKLWPSRSGILHGVKEIEERGNSMVITTHCGERFMVWNSKNSRSARWLRNRWHKRPCPKCQIPEWKLKKYSETVFTDFKR